MTSSTRPTTPAILLAVIALIALLLSLLGDTAAVATDDGPGDDAACAPDEAPDESDASVDTEESGDPEESSDAEEDCDDDGDTFTDVPANSPHVEGISWLGATGVTKGCKEGRFCPNRPVTRAEFATLAGRMVGQVEGVEPVAAPADELEALRQRVAELETMVTELESRVTDLE